jgi:hypothetical protein
MKAVNTYEIPAYFYQNTQLNMPEDKRLHTRRHENLKSRLLLKRRKTTIGKWGTLSSKQVIKAISLLSSQSGKR